MTANLKQKWASPTYAKHRAKLQQRGITVEQAIEDKLEPMTPKETWSETHQQIGDTIAITCLKADGSAHAARRFEVVDDEIRRTTGKRYTQKAGTGAIIHIRQPKKLTKKDKRGRVIWWTEGEHKANAIARATGDTAGSVPGVNSFLENGAIHPDIAALKLTKADTVKLVYDTDQERKVRVMKAQLQFADLLNEIGVAVKFVDLQSVPNIAKTGVDDAFKHFGADALLKATEHDFESEWTATWREIIAKTADTKATLPPALSDLKPVDSSWYAKKPAEARYIVAPFWQEGESAQLAGQAGVGKSYTSMEMFVSIGTGTDFFGYPVPEPRKALYLMCERHETSLHRRWHKVTRRRASDLKDHDLKRFEKLLHENCYLKAIAGDTLTLIEFFHNQWQPSAAVDALIEELKAAGITVLFLDPLSRLHGGNENDNAVGAAITKALERIAQLAGCSVMFIHHTGKNGRDDMYAGRGSSAFNDNTSETIVLTKVEANDRQALDLSCLRPDELFYDIVKMHHARCSDGRPAPDTYLVRNGETGLLRRIMIEKKSTEVVLAEGIDSVRQWLTRLGVDTFSRTQFIKSKSEFSKWSRIEVTKVFDDSVLNGLFLQATETRNGETVPMLRKGYQLYRINPEIHPQPAMNPRIPGLIRDSGTHLKQARF